MSHQPNPDFFTYLPLLNTEEIIAGIGNEWKRPAPEKSRNSELQMDGIILQWINFCENAKEGRKIGIDTVENGHISLDLVSIEAYLAFYHAMGKGEKYPEVIENVETALGMLLSAEGVKKLEVPIKPIQVDQDLRKKINKLVKNLGHIAESHAQASRREWANFDED